LAATLNAAFLLGVEKTRRSSLEKKTKKIKAEPEEEFFYQKIDNFLSTISILSSCIA